MATSAPSANNLAVKFRSQPQKERPRMPVVSKAQNAAMQAAKDGNSTLGIPQKVGAEFVADQKPGDVKKLPQRKKSRADRLRDAGRISEKAHAKMMGGK